MPADPDPRRTLGIPNRLDPFARRLKGDTYIPHRLFTLKEERWNVTGSSILDLHRYNGEGIARLTFGRWKEAWMGVAEQETIPLDPAMLEDTTLKGIRNTHKNIS